ncbi:MAG: hypothetical protein K9G64_08975 [Bacteroidia bacterium]|jgi:hypothetical protein|nr:hypothetical protein [Bacteroidia bacterium]
MESEKKAINEKVYTIRITDYDDSTSNIAYEIKGFNTFEILGVIKYVETKLKQDLLK